MQKTQKAFTLVELIVVIIILAILGTISFISLQGYSKAARDSRRMSDINNIKISLEVFIMNTGYYPLPDNGEEVDYEDELLWTQGTVGDSVTTNLSRTLIQKPTDPLYDFEYVYSITNSKKEYEVMSIYEKGLSNNNLLSNTYAGGINYVKVEGTYNGIFVKTPGYIVPTPSIVTSEEIGLGLSLNKTNIDSMVVTNGKNIPTLNIPNTKTSTGKLDIHLSVYTGSITADMDDSDKKLITEKIQQAYTGTTLSNKGIYSTILSKTDGDDLVEIFDDIVLPKGNLDIKAPNSVNTPTDCDVGYYGKGSSCVPAIEGYFVSSSGSLEQISCTTGQYQDEVGQTTYKNCTNKPDNSVYTTSDGLTTNTCPWSCNNGYLLNGSICSLIQNGSCNNSTPLGCSVGNAINNNGQSSCGTSRTWNCEGLYGGNTSGQCNYYNGACCTPNGSYTYGSCSVSSCGQTGTKPKYNSCGSYVGTASCSTGACCTWGYRRVCGSTYGCCTTGIGTCITNIDGVHLCQTSASRQCSTCGSCSNVYGCY